MPSLPTRSEIESARAIVRRAVPPTPQYAWPLLAQAVEPHQAAAHLERAHRGVVLVLDPGARAQALRERGERVPGVASATRGNHGQSVGFAARALGIPATIVVPHGNSREKNAAMRALGVELVEHGEDFQAAREHAQALARERGLLMVPSFHPDLVRGVATYWLEFYEAVPELDVVYVPIGLGSGACGALAAREALGRRVEVVGVVSQGAPTYALSLAAGRVVEAPVTTVIADGMACRVAEPQALELMLGRLDRVVAVSDAQVAHAMRALFIDTHNVAEGAGAAPPADSVSPSQKRAISALTM